MSSTDIDRAVNGDARRASLSMLLVSISLGLHWRHLTARSELGDALELQRVELFHLRLLGGMRTSRVHAAVKTAVERSVACGVQPIPQLSRWRAHQRERKVVGGQAKFCPRSLRRLSVPRHEIWLTPSKAYAYS